MENTKFDRKKVIEEMQKLKTKIIEDIKTNYPEKSEKEIDNEIQHRLLNIKYLGKIELTNEYGELVEKNWYAVIEQHSGEFQITYYDENQSFLGVQKGMEENILPAESLMWNKPKEMEKIKEKDIEKARTLEQLEEDEKQEEKKKQTQELSKKQSETQLTKAQVNTLSGPKTKMSQIVNGIPLRNIIGLEGEYIQLVDADTLRKILPDVKVPASQKNIPIEIFPDGTANVIGEDKLKLSNVEGTNSIKEHTTVTNEGMVRQEQNIETFNIVATGAMNVISIGYDENYYEKDYQEIKFGVRDIEHPTQIAYSELESVHFDPIQDDNTREYIKETADGKYKGTNTIERAEKHEKCEEELEAEDVDADKNNDNIHDEDVLRYAQAMNIRIVDEHGYPTTEYDLELAKQELEERLEENPDASIEEIIEGDQKQLGPQDNRRY